MDTHTVYIRTVNGDAVEVNSSAFLTDTDGWTEIDEGEGDRYHHAQGNYFDKPLMTDGGVYRYRYADGKITEKTIAEIEAEEAVLRIPVQIAALKFQLAETDYRVIKSYEYSLTGLDVPYDIETLHAERQALRDQINALEVML